MLNKTLLVSAIAALTGCATSAPPPSREVSLETWADHHPEASKELGVWVREHAQAAALFFDWDGHHAVQSQELVTWTLGHPAEPLEAFTGSHPGWPKFDRIMESHRPAAESFMAWARRHPEAAEALMHHPGGLEWAGHHLYAADWHMETP